MKGAVVNPTEIREFTTTDGYVLRYRHYRPIGTARAFVIGLHGIQSHSGWYEWSSQRLADAGFDVRFLDRRGSGLNETDRGHADSAAQLQNDVLRFVRTIRGEMPAGTKLVLTSVSWGGKLAASLPARASDAALCNFDGIALLYPAIFTKVDPVLPLRAAIRFAAAVGLGYLRVAIPLDDPRLFTGESHWQQFIRDDPLALRRTTISFLNATLKLTRQAKSLPDVVSPPMFIALPGKDEILDLPRTRRWVARLPAENTRVVEYPQARHTLEFDPCREQFVTDLIEWIESVVNDRSLNCPSRGNREELS